MSTDGELCWRRYGAHWVSRRLVPGRDTDEQIIAVPLDLLRERAFG